MKVHIEGIMDLINGEMAGETVVGGKATEGKERDVDVMVLRMYHLVPWILVGRGENKSLFLILYFYCFTLFLYIDNPD